MKKLLSNENLFVIQNIRQILEQAGIPCSIKNEFVTSGSGELPHFEVWPELWSIRDSDHQKAEKIIQDINDSDLEEWTCDSCKEINVNSFDFCWNCDKGRPSSTQ